MKTTKKCGRCRKGKPLEAFNFRNKKKGIHQNTCRSCTREQVRKHYQKNRGYYLKKALKRNETQKQAAMTYILNFLSNHHCIDCGEKDPVVLDFDHRENKTYSISDLVRNKYSLDTIEKEIRKCDIRCANCHRRKTAKEFGWYKYNSNNPLSP